MVTRDGAVTEIGTSQNLGRCPGVTGVSTVGRDVVFGCADGAVRIVRRAGALTAEPMPSQANRRIPVPSYTGTAVRL